MSQGRLTPLPSPQASPTHPSMSHPSPPSSCPLPSPTIRDVMGDASASITRSVSPFSVSSMPRVPSALSLEPEVLRRISNGSSEGDTPSLLPLDDDESRGRKRKRVDDENTLDFIMPPPDHLLCSICHEVFTKPVIVNGCGHEFCQNCLDTAVLRSRQCPMCRHELPTGLAPYYTPLRRVADEVGKLKVRCPFSHGGCSAVTTVDRLRAHLDHCVFSVVPCVHAEHGCEWDGTRQYLTQHLRACPYEQLRGFTQRTSAEIGELRETNARLQGEIKRLKSLEAVIKMRGERLKQALRNKIKPQPVDLKDKVTVVRVVEGGSVQWMFKVKMSLRLDKIVDIVQKKRDTEIILTCDGPLHLGGTIIEKGQSLFDLGVGYNIGSTHQGTVLYAEAL